jgi:hypothetical protein
VSFIDISAGSILLGVKSLIFIAFIYEIKLDPLSLYPANSLSLHPSILLSLLLYFISVLLYIFRDMGHRWLQISKNSLQGFSSTIIGAVVEERWAGGSTFTTII